MLSKFDTEHTVIFVVMWQNLQIWYQYGNTEDLWGNCWETVRVFLDHTHREHDWGEEKGVRGGEWRDSL